MELLDVFSEGKAYRERVYALYEEAFPAEEKKPLDIMEKLVQQGKMEILAVADEESFVGLAINMMTEDKALLDYFAISPEIRGGGYGSRAIRLLLERFAEKPYFFEVEMRDASAPNAEERERRIAFYLRNGLKETGLYVNVYRTDFQILTPDGKAVYEDYLEILDEILGRDFRESVLKPYRLPPG